jgi:hypothetical protein
VIFEANTVTSIAEYIHYFYGTVNQISSNGNRAAELISIPATGNAPVLKEMALSSREVLVPF